MNTITYKQFPDAKLDICLDLMTPKALDVNSEHAPNLKEQIVRYVWNGNRRHMIPREVEKKRKGETHDLICREARELFITFDTSCVGMLFVFCFCDFNSLLVFLKSFDLELWFSDDCC